MSPGAARKSDLLEVFDKHDMATTPGRVHTIYSCPGCARWTVEVNVPGVDPAPATAGASFAALAAMVEVIDSLEAAGEVATAHRGACPGLDMLAGLVGSPAENDCDPS